VRCALEVGNELERMCRLTVLVPIEHLHTYSESSMSRCGANR
jgi:hypothetical protein